MQVARKVPGHGYASANANRPGLVMVSNFSANIFRQLFRPIAFVGRLRRGSGFYLHKESRVAEMWILGTQTFGAHQRSATEASQEETEGAWLGMS